MARDDFTSATIGTLARRVANICSNPTCGAVTSGPHTDESKALNIGVASHITAASPGGARYDASVNSDERKSPANGIWLCQFCGKLVDNDAMRYPVELLGEWKRKAEENALAQIEQRPIPNPPSIAKSIQFALADWSIWREQGNHPSRGILIMSGWAAGEIQYSFKLRLRNTSEHEEQLHRLRIQFRCQDEVLLDDWYSIQFELTLPAHKWITRPIHHGLHMKDLGIYQRTDSIWFAAEVVGTDEEFARKVADVDPTKPLPVC